ncbi:pantetheine-phosphate adenylyltransferase [Canibacter zhoujuaniae]|uniref:pantetheine-phosphate adenylyltransferase n=1 Tax=Canibacter zhoujuaniae TaxID=2708343 RepID=UPI00141FC9BC|nr:pantetheine-phosphate adenylyltransferase [Canibacter zhoujuaniae]
MTSIAVVPGSFDPVTFGHLDVIERAATIFDEVHVVVVHNPDKKPLLSLTSRIDLIRTAVEKFDTAAKIVVTGWQDGLLVEYCKQVGATVLVKGVRNQQDIGYETQMVLMNRSLAGIETMFVLPDPAFSAVSSSLVRQVFHLGGDVSEYVPQHVIDIMAAAALSDENSAAE